MKRIPVSHLMLRFLLLALLAIPVSACSDWTEEEGVEVAEPDYGPNYERYLAELRAYRNTDHKVVYAWFENIEQPVSQAHHLTAVPDSVDIINLMTPEIFPDWQRREMEEVRTSKGIRFVYSVSYPELEALYNEALSAGEIQADGETDPFLGFATDFLDRKLALFNADGYDGIAVLFNGKKTLHMTEAEKATYLAREALFMGRIAAWRAANPNSLFIFEGKPQNLTDKSILTETEFIVIRTEGVVYESSLDYEVMLCIEEGVPTDRFVISAQPKSLDVADTKTGFICNDENQWVPFLPAAAEWVATRDSRFAKVGLGVYKIQNDYYYKSQSYINTRVAIGMINPSPKF